MDAVYNYKVNFGREKKNEQFNKADRKASDDYDCDRGFWDFTFFDFCEVFRSPIDSDCGVSVVMDGYIDDAGSFWESRSTKRIIPYR